VLVLRHVNVASRRSPQYMSHQIKLGNAWGPVKRTKTSPSKMPSGNDADTYGKTRAHPENIKVRRVLMYQPWLVSHPNGRSDKSTLFSGPGEMLSRSHALTSRDVYHDVIIAPEYFVNALPKEQPWRLARESGWEILPGWGERRYQPQKLTRFNVSSPACFFYDPNDFCRDDRYRKYVIQTGHNLEYLFVFSCVRSKCLRNNNHF